MARWLFIFVGVSLIAACGSGSAREADAGTQCASASECDDGVYCNGEERCAPEQGGADARGCILGPLPCLESQGFVCDEDLGACESNCAEGSDRDGDGVDAIACGGTDCDDGDARRYPGATERCDPIGLDEDCDPLTLAGPSDGDDDLDGYISDECCNEDAMTRTFRCGPDCNDERAAASPESVETCNTSDDDCDGLVDEGVTTAYYVDADGDGFGAGEAIQACQRPEGYREDASDCDDTAATVHPGAYDRCDVEMRDDDCNDTPNDPPGGCDCLGAASRSCPLLGVCGGSMQQCVDGAWGDCAVGPIDEICGNLLDDDCDGEADENCPCAVPVRFCGSDEGVCERGIQACLPDGSWGPCTDSVGPEVETRCDGLDEDCDGIVDEGAGTVCYLDSDADGYATASATSRVICGGSCQGNETQRAPIGDENIDCDDADGRAHPGQTSFFATARTGVGGFDFNCDGSNERGSYPVSQLPCPVGLQGSCNGVENDTGLRALPGCGQRGDRIACFLEDMGSSGEFCVSQVVSAGFYDAMPCR